MKTHQFSARFKPTERLEMNRFQPWSLLEMLKFYADKFIKMIRLLDHLVEFSNKHGPKNIKPILQDILSTLDSIMVELLRMEATVSWHGAIRLKELLESEDFSESQLKQSVAELANRIEDEFSGRLFFHIRDYRHYENSGLLGYDALQKFPDLLTDISEAGSCFCFERYSACVFHLMRIMESLVQKLGVDFTDIPDIKNENWKNIVDRVRRKIKEQYPKEKDHNRIAWDSILAYLDTVRIAWRNPTMHPKQTYTEEEAEGILDAVKIFAKELAKMI